MPASLIAGMLMLGATSGAPETPFLIFALALAGLVPGIMRRS